MLNAGRFNFGLIKAVMLCQFYLCRKRSRLIIGQNKIIWIKLGDFWLAANYSKHTQKFILNNKTSFDYTFCPRTSQRLDLCTLLSRTQHAHNFHDIFDEFSSLTMVNLNKFKIYKCDSAFQNTTTYAFQRVTQTTLWSFNTAHLQVNHNQFKATDHITLPTPF